MEGYAKLLRAVNMSKAGRIGDDEVSGNSRLADVYCTRGVDGLRDKWSVRNVILAGARNHPIAGLET